MAGWGEPTRAEKVSPLGTSMGKIAAGRSAEGWKSAADCGSSLDPVILG